MREYEVVVMQEVKIRIEAESENHANVAAARGDFLPDQVLASYVHKVKSVVEVEDE